VGILDSIRTVINGGGEKQYALRCVHANVVEFDDVRFACFFYVLGNLFPR